MFKSRKFFVSLIAVIVFCAVSFAVYSYNFSQPEIKFDVYNGGIYVVEINSDYFAKNSDIYVSESVETVDSAAEKLGAKVAINAGFFDLTNKKTVSFVQKGENIIVNPQENEHLTQSEELKPHLDKIFNRAEFRVLSCPVDKISPDGKIVNEENLFKVSNHFEGLEYNNYCDLKYSIQAGPKLLPEFDLEKEFFVLKKDGKVIRESASALEKVARSAIGVKKDSIVLVAASNNSPLTLKELADFMKKLGVEQALAFDGGSSTSLYVNYTQAGLPSDKPVFSLVSAKDNTARKVKSILILK